jgi:hypothetical protein
MLIEMADALTPQKRREIKARWIEKLLPLVGPLCR